MPPLQVPPEQRFVDDGYSGATLIRPALDRLRDLVSVGANHRIYAHSLVEEQDLVGQENQNVRNKHAYFMHGQNHTGGVGETANIPGNRFRGMPICNWDWNANNRRFRLACTVGLRVFVCHNLAFRGDYTPVLAKHSKRFSLEDALSIGVDRMQRNFDPMRQQVELWRAQQLSAEEAKLTIYGASSRAIWASRNTSPKSTRTLFQSSA